MKTIIAPLDFSDSTSPVLEAATMLARAFQARIVLVHVFRPLTITSAYSPDIAGLALQAETDESEQLAHWRQELQSDGLTVETSECFGDPATCIRSEAQRLGADFIVIGSHGHGAMYDLVVGGTAAGLIKNAPCPVLVLNPSDVPTPAGAEANLHHEAT